MRALIPNILSRVAIGSSALFASTSTSLKAAASFSTVAAAAAASPTLGTLLFTSIKVIAGANAIGFAITTITKSHKITDLTGTMSFPLSAWATHLIMCRATATPILAINPSLLMTLSVTAWAFRLGGFLFRRVMYTETDERLSPFFSKPGEPLLTGPSKYPLRLAGFWFLQGMWAFVCVLPVTATQTLIASAGKAGTASAVVATNPALVAIGGLIFLAGFTLETVADSQKFAFKKDPANRGKFIGARGIYKYSQYPNYAGEMAVWSGLWLASGPAVWVAAPWTVLSPLFTILLLTKVSGIPLAEEKNKRLYSQDRVYQEYKKKTPLLLPWFPQQ